MYISVYISVILCHYVIMPLYRHLPISPFPYVPLYNDCCLKFYRNPMSLYVLLFLWPYPLDHFVHMSLCPYFPMSIRPYVYMSLCPYVHMSLCTYAPICLYVPLSLYPYVLMSLCLYVCMSLCHYVSIFLCLLSSYVRMS